MSKSHRASRHTRPALGAFTLVELLVVIGIISVLVSILLPALGSARESAQTVKCMSNLRQIGIGLRIYASNNKDVLPPLYTFDFLGGGMARGGYWATVLNESKTMPTSATSESNNTFMCPSSLNIKVDAFWTYASTRTSNTGYFTMQGTNGSGSQDVRVSYAANGMNIGTYNASGQIWWTGNPKYWCELFPFVPTAKFSANPVPKPTRFSKIRKSTVVPLLFDGLSMHDMVPAQFQLRHGRQRGPEKERLCNVVFADGHAASVPGARLPKPGDNLWGDPAGIMSSRFYDVKLAVGER